METGNINLEDSKFIQKVLNFCSAIDRYRVALALESKDIEAFKGDINVLSYVSWHYPSFSPSFVQYHVTRLHRRYDDMTAACKRSPNYSRHIGLELGIETVYHQKNIYSEYLGVAADEARQPGKMSR